MSKTFTLLAMCCLFALAAKAQQTAPALAYEAYGKVDKEDLEMASCDFEKDANAEVLIDKGDLYYDQTFNYVMECHKRIKIFNDNGKNVASIHIKFLSANHNEYVTGLQGETINLNNGKMEITKLDKKLVYTQVIDKNLSQLVFTMPNIKAGSIIEYKYTITSARFYDLPTWYFQETIPVRYSELDTSIPDWLYFKTQTMTLAPYAKRNTSSGNGSYGSGVGQDAVTYNTNIDQRVMTNIPSLVEEPYMTSDADNLQRIVFQLSTFRPPGSFSQTFDDTWPKVGGDIAEDADFGKQVSRKLAGEDDIISKAEALSAQDDKIAFIFNMVKSTMKWDGDDQWYTNDGIKEAWDKKTGNSTEINLILYRLLNKSGIKDVYPLMVSTRDNGKVNPAYPSIRQFNRAVVYIHVDSTKSYVLDATGKYNMYNETPYNLLNSDGLCLDLDKRTFRLISITKPGFVRRSVYINAEIKPDGKMSGNAQISNFSYNRINNIDRYKTDGETKFINYLTDDDNNLKISSLKFDNMDVDTLPLVQNIDFNLYLAGSDDNYIYFKPNIFTLLNKNPFLSETRNTNIDFGYQDNLTVNGVYKIPAGYKVDALPKNIIMTMPDQSITFRRVMAEQDGNIAVRYVLSYHKSIYFKEQYADLHEFYKKLYEMMNEQIVLKKS